MQIKATVTCSFVPLRLAKNKKLINIYCWQGCEETGPQFYLSWERAVL